MPITIGYNPNAGLIGQMAFQGGMGNYNQVQQQLKQQADLQNAARYDDRWALETQIANQQYLNSVNNNQALTQQARGFQNTNYGQGQSIADAQKRAQMGIDDAQVRQQRGIEADVATQGRSLEDAAKARELQSQLTQYTTQFGAWDAQTRQAQAVAAEEQNLRMQLSAAAMRQSQAAQAQAASQAAQQQFQGQLAQFNAGQDMARLGAQGSIQSMLSGQSYRQNVGLQGMASQDQMALQELRGQQQQDLTGMEFAGRLDQSQNEFLMQNMLGPYAGYADQISARQAQIQDSQYQQKLSALDAAVQQGKISPTSPAYQQARNEILQQRLGLQQKIGMDRSMLQAEFDQSLVYMGGDAKTGQPFIKGPNGYEPADHPYDRYQVQEAQARDKIKADMRQAEMSARIEALKAAQGNPQAFQWYLQELGFKPANGVPVPMPAGVGPMAPGVANAPAFGLAP